MTRLVLGYRNESLIPYFPGAYSLQDEEKVKSKDINIIQWGKYFRTSKYWVQWGSRVLGCLGSLFIRAMRTPWKEIHCVCVCVCVCVCTRACSCAHLQGCILYVCLDWIHWSTKYRDNSCPTILIQLHAITCWKPGMKRQISDQPVIQLQNNRSRRELTKAEAARLQMNWCNW